jgi:tetratricopeptide (TPR) repeat protein
VQQEISREITDRLRLKLTGEEQKQLTRRDTTNPEAYSSYLKGRYYWNKRTAENVGKAVEQFKQAADKDPNYALAYVGLADCYVVLGDYTGTPTSETVPKARAFAERALQLDGSLAEAHASLAFSDAQLWQWQEAEEEFNRAITLNSNYPTVHHWYSVYLLQTGRPNEALREIVRAQQLDPVSAIITFNVANTHLSLGDLNSATEQARRLIELEPGFSRGPNILGLIHLKQGLFAEALTELERAVAMSARRDRQNLRDLGYSYGISGRRAEALSILREIRANYEKHQALGQDLAAVYAGLGEKDQAFDWLEKDFQARDARLPRIRYLVPFESLRNDSRYTDLLRRMGLKA